MVVPYLRRSLSQVVIPTLVGHRAVSTLTSGLD